MHSFLFVFEFLGTTELLVIAVVALILFGPRKLPEIGRTVGRGLAEFKRASDDFKRTWEYEVEIEKRQPPAAPNAVQEAAPVETAALPAYDAGEHTIARGAAVEDDPLWADEYAGDVATGRARSRRADAEDELNAS